MIRRILLIASIAFSPFVGIFAQHEFSLYGGGGLSALSYKVDDAEQKDGFGGQFGLGYRYSVKRNFGIVSGVGLAIYNASFEALNMGTRSVARDIVENVDFDFHSVLSGYEEKQGATLLQIPVMGQYLYNLGQLQCYANGGVKFGIPLGGQFSSSVASIKNTGFYAEEQFEYEVQRFRGFDTFERETYRGDLDFKVAVLFSLEAGVKFALSGELSLYAGAYFDYGLSNIHKSIAPKFVEYNETNPEYFNVNSVIYSKYEGFTDKIMPFAAGIKIALALEK